MKNLPKKIYLNFGDASVSADDYANTDYNDLSDVTFCEDRIDEYDHCYIDDCIVDSQGNPNSDQIAEMVAENQTAIQLQREVQRLKEDLIISKAKETQSGYIDFVETYYVRSDVYQAKKSEVERLKDLPREIYKSVQGMIAERKAIGQSDEQDAEITVLEIVEYIVEKECEKYGLKLENEK